jgi:hypothetical protein
MAKSPTYSVWRGMKTRCLNRNSTFYAEYGGRGITICQAWLGSFEAFYADMGAKPDNMSLERKNNDAGYSPENCVWATRTTQSRNRRGRRLLTVGAETLTMAEWAERAGIRLRTVWERCRLGWTDEEAVTTPIWAAGAVRSPIARYEHDGIPNDSLPVVEAARTLIAHEN